MKGRLCEIDVPEDRWTAWQLVVAVLVKEDVEEKMVVVQWTQVISQGC